jgi:hypothetical protein
MVGWEVPVVPRQDAHVTLVEVTIGLAKYTMDKYWMGINHHPPTKDSCKHFANSSGQLTFIIVLTSQLN